MPVTTSRENNHLALLNYRVNAGNNDFNVQLFRCLSISSLAQTELLSAVLHICNFWYDILKIFTLIFVKIKNILETSEYHFM